MRSLATIQKITEIKTHPNADAIELAVVRGWQVVVKRGDFKPGDFVVYFEIDSFLPVREEFEFLRKSCFRTLPELGDGFRLRTIKLRGELSQGLLMPLSILDNQRISSSETVQWGQRTWNEEWQNWDYNIIPCEEGVDVTSLLGVQKYEPPVSSCLMGNVKGYFPSFIRKTDQERVQNCWDYVKSLNTEWELTEKLDGSSCTIYTNFKRNVADGYYEIGVCSRNQDLKLENNENNAFIRTVIREGYLETLPKLNMNIAIQAELCGPGIQGNKLKLNQIELFVFDIWMIDQQRYATRLERNSIIFQLTYLGVQVKQVPHLGSSRLPDTLAECLNLAESKSKINPNAEREGVVFKALTMIDGEVPSFKAISNKFLMNEKD